MQGGLLLDVVVGQGSTVFQLLSSEDQSLLIWRNSLFILNFGLYVLDGVGSFDVQSDGLSGQGLNEYLHFKFTINQ